MNETTISPEIYQRIIQIARQFIAKADIDALCAAILAEAQAITRADGATLYLIQNQGENQHLKFTFANNRSLGFIMQPGEDELESLPFLSLFDSESGEANHHNVATHVALTHELVNIDDAYMDQSFDFTGTRDFDQHFGYRSQSFLTIPLASSPSRVVGVLQLINCLDQEANVIPFDKDLEAVIQLLASFAAIALERQLQMDEQRALLEDLSGEPNTQRILERILEETQLITHADGGSLYLLNEEGGAPQLEFALIRNNPLGLRQGGGSSSPIETKPIPMFFANDEPNLQNVACYCAHNKVTVNVDNAYSHDEFDFSDTHHFDQKNKYKSTSFLTVPLLNHDDDVIGVLQLINAKHQQTREVIPFSDDLIPVVEALSTYASIALNNQILVEDLKSLLDAFIKCIARAIDAKSPHTSGHCERVPLLTELIAQAACDDQFELKDFSLDSDGWYELKVASWLHDCGKLSTPDSVLEKSTKLHLMRDGVHELNARFQTIKLQYRLEAAEGRLSQTQLREKLVQLEADRLFISQANKGSEFMSQEDKSRVQGIAQYRWQNADGQDLPLLTEVEIYNLCIERGTLTSEEREVINNHMVVTIDMLESLPFPRKLRRVPEYAGGHHEKMDGSGFPKGLTREQMSLPARMMAIADIFEALTAKDRPYKDPMKISQALGIMSRMRDNNHIDPDIFQLFLRANVWQQYAEQVLNPAQIDISNADEFMLVSV